MVKMVEAPGVEPGSANDPVLGKATCLVAVLRMTVALPTTKLLRSP